MEITVTGISGNCTIRWNRKYGISCYGAKQLNKPRFVHFNIRSKMYFVAIKICSHAFSSMWCKLHISILGYRNTTYRIFDLPNLPACLACQQILAILPNSVVVLKWSWIECIWNCIEYLFPFLRSLSSNSFKRLNRNYHKNFCKIPLLWLHPAEQWKRTRHYLHSI